MDSYPHNEKTRPTSGDYQPHGHSNHPNPSNSDLLSSAKVLADAVMHRGGETEFDKGKAADAAADILHAASQYGKFDDKPIGKMVGQAEDYLHKYNTSHSSTTTNPGNGGGHSTTTTTTSSESHSSPPDKEHAQGHSSGGGYGDYMKMAEGLFNKNSGTGHGSGGATTHSSENSSDGGNKYGEYLNMAEGVFNKYSGGGNEHNNTTGGDAHNSTTGGDAHSGGQHGKSGSGGYGEYAELAGDFLKKH